MLRLEECEDAIADGVVHTLLHLITHDITLFVVCQTIAEPTVARAVSAHHQLFTEVDHTILRLNIPRHLVSIIVHIICREHTRQCGELEVVVIEHQHTQVIERADINRRKQVVGEPELHDMRSTAEVDRFEFVAAEVKFPKFLVGELEVFDCIVGEH